MQPAAFSSLLSFPQVAMDRLSSLSAEKTTTGERRETKGFRKVLLVFFVLLTVNSGLVMYISWGDLVSVASVGVTYVAVGLLLGRRFGCLDGGRRWLDHAICFLLLSLGVLEVSSLARTTAASPPMLVAAAAAAALVVGGGCAYLLHRRSWYKEQSHEAIFLPLRQPPS